MKTWHPLQQKYVHKPNYLMLFQFAKFYSFALLAVGPCSFLGNFAELQRFCGSSCSLRQLQTGTERGRQGQIGKEGTGEVCIIIGSTCHGKLNLRFDQSPTLHWLLIGGCDVQILKYIFSWSTLDFRGFCWWYVKIPHNDLLWSQANCVQWLSTEAQSQTW